jgi:hypothetical protein
LIEQWRVEYSCLPLSIQDACCLYREHLFFATYRIVTNWSSLETCLWNCLRWANVRADLKTLTQILTKEY